MMQVKFSTIFLLCLTILFFSCGCETKAYPDERINIDKKFVDFFNLFVLSDTIKFQNGTGKEKKMIVSKIDSSKLNKKGWFINGGYHNRYTCFFSEVGHDTLKLARQNKISVSKAPESNLNGILIQFGNLFFNDTLLPKLYTDTIVLGKKVISEYYFIRTTLSSTSATDVDELYISPEIGVFAIKMHSGEFWIR